MRFWTCGEPGRASMVKVKAPSAIDAGALQTTGTALQLGYVTLVQNSIAAGPACDEEIPDGVAAGGHVNSQGEGNPR